MTSRMPKMIASNLGMLICSNLTMVKQSFHQLKRGFEMQTAFLKLLLLSSALALVAPLSHAKHLDSDTCGTRRCQVKLQGVVERPARSLFVMAMHFNSPGVELHDQIVAGLSLDSVLSAGNAQQSVNQEGVRDKPAEHDAANTDATKQNSRSQQTLNKSARPAPNLEEKSNIESAGESGNGSTASGSADGPLRRTPAKENW
jgi:mannitol-specific phosphotransferase system IIBC component